MASTSFEFPPLDYSLLFPDLINFHMIKNPSFPMFIYPNESVPDTLTEISFLEFGRAAHRVAHALRPDRQGPDGEVVMIIANTDTILYHAVLVGLSIAGCIPFPVSPRNSAAAVVSMKKKTNCTRIVTLDHAHKALINDILCEHEGDHLIISESPTLQYAFPRLGAESADDPFVEYPSTERRPDLDSPALYLHSSGSTGFPKPIAHSYRIQIQWMTLPHNHSFCDLRAPRRIGSMGSPPFHAIALITHLYIPLACVVSTVVYSPCSRKDLLAPPVMPTSDNTIEYLKKTGYQVLFTFPTFLEQMVRSQEAIENLKKLDAVRFGGGPTPVKVADALCAAGVRLLHTYGSTEMGVPVAITDEEDSEEDCIWMRFSDELKIRWVPQGDGTYELHILSTEDRRMAVENLLDVKGYATSDLFVKHPTKNLWRIIGRVDDVINLASGENVVPAPMESIIGSSPLVQGVVMFGRGRNQVGVLIEPRLGHPIDIKDRNAVAEFRDQIWSVIEDANRPAPTFSRIFKEMILVTSGDKPMLRTPKGTVQRKGTLNAYDVEITAMYDGIESSPTVPGGLAGPSAWTSEVLEKWLLEHALSVGTGNYVDPHVDLFTQGFDSLSATHLRNRLLAALRKSPNLATKKATTYVHPNVIYENPTIRLLSSRIAALVNDGGSYQAIDSIDKHKQVINAMIKKYSTELDGPVDGVLPSSQLLEPAVVLITGTTGGLGSLLLLDLLKSPGVQRVFAFNRPSSKKKIEERQKSAFEDRGLPLNLLASNKLIYVEADASLEKCGLPLAQYEEIRKSLTLIIHNAWRLDFNLAISSFDENIRASRNLIDLGLDSPQKSSIRYLFTSSVGSAQGWNNSNGPFPEEVQQDPAVAVGIGYGESKYVTERMIVKSGLHATSLRIGQIGGGSGGSWATTDWFPIIVKSSIALGLLPDAAGVVSWLRDEEVASTVLEIAFAKEAPPPVLNIVNPRNTPWSDIITFVRHAIIRRKRLADDALPIVPFGDWFALLENKARDASKVDLVKIPAIKLLEFFHSLARADEAIRGVGDSVTEAMGMKNFSSSKAQQVSTTMANMQAIGEAEADAWVGYWMSKGGF